jgi:hypothetical protein
VAEAFVAAREVFGVGLGSPALLCTGVRQFEGKVVAVTFLRY